MGTWSLSAVKGLALVCVLVLLALSAESQVEIKLGGRRIVGGEETDIREHLWQVALIVRQSKGPYLCGGAIVAQQWVLTAAHCLESSTLPTDIQAKAGATRYLSDGTWIAAERAITYPQYDQVSYEHDIALLKVKLGSAGRVIPFVGSMEMNAGQNLEVTGWGATRDGGSNSDHLLKGTVPYVDTLECNDPAVYAGRIKPSMMCAGRREGGTDACQGDSGGPLVWRSPDGPLLVGIVSFGEGCARQLRYGVYTRVQAYRDWIRTTLRAS
jgi:secreted trypsin-like serine protease